MNAEIQELYQEVILDHNRQPRNFRVLEGGRRAEGYNPLCGDRLIVYLRVEDGTIRDVAFHGSGCAISKASASLMTESVKGKSVAEAGDLFQRFQQMITAPPNSPGSAKTNTVMNGISALRSAWREMTSRSTSPLARAVRT